VRTYLIYTTVYPKSPRILFKVSCGNASNSSEDNKSKSIFFSTLFLPFKVGGWDSAASNFLVVLATFFFSTIFSPTTSFFGASSAGKVGLITYLAAFVFLHL
jgi:hypothetical protein